MKILVTGGAGFIGSHLSLALRERLPGAAVTALDELKRRGNELALPRLRRGGITFQHGDVRAADDSQAAGPVDLLVECSAEAERARRLRRRAGVCGADQSDRVDQLPGTSAAAWWRLIFLSRSGLPVARVRALPLERVGDRLMLKEGRVGEGWSEAGISEAFPLHGSRSLYGATKLAAEQIIEEYASPFTV